MKTYFKASLVLLALLVICSSNVRTYAQGNSTIADIVAVDARFTRLNTAINSANLRNMFRGAGPYTLFAPTDDALASLDLDNANELRRIVLYHTIQASISLNELSQKTQLRTAFGKNLTLASDNGSILLNNGVRIVVSDIKATNGTIHLIDAILTPATAEVSAEIPAAAQATNKPLRSTESINSLATESISNPLAVTNPSQNPSFISGGQISYWSGIHSDSNSCKGLTWTLQYQVDTVVKVGSDRASNPYRGDTPCATELPLLCLQRDRLSQPPESSSGHDYFNGWAFGNVRHTLPIAGTQLDSRATADALCEQAFGAGARMAEFHDGNLGEKTGAQSGHDFWAYGALPASQRFWVAINDQPANPWNSVNPVGEPPALLTDNVFLAGADPAYVGIGPARMSADEGLNAGQNGCQGNTWVLHKQINGKVQVGGDHSSNPFVGDRSCADRYPILCIRVDGWNPPANSHNEDYSYGWSGGWVKASNAVSGKQLDTRENANAICQESFGSAWRMAEFHDGSLGTSSTNGWEFWAYGSLPAGLRYWVAINDQLANPWNR